MFWIPIERSSTKPLIRQVYEHIRAQILCGALQEGTQLLSTRELAANLHISRNVVLEAYDQLLAEGYVESRAGSGTYVADGIHFEKGSTRPDVSPDLSVASSRTEDQPIDFRSGLPALDLFPRKQWGQLAQHVYAEVESAIFGYDNPEGRPELRTALGPLSPAHTWGLLPASTHPDPIGGIPGIFAVE